MELIEIAAHFRPELKPEDDDETVEAQARLAARWSKALLEAVAEIEVESRDVHPRVAKIAETIQPYLDTFKDAEVQEVSANMVKRTYGLPDGFVHIAQAIERCGWEQAGRKRMPGSANVVTVYSPGQPQVRKWWDIGEQRVDPSGGLI